MEQTIQSVVTMRASLVDHAAALAFFLLAKTGSVWGTWRGRLTAREQRALFGRHLGKGSIIVDGMAETITHRVKVAFGLDYDDTARLSWRDLGA